MVTLFTGRMGLRAAAVALLTVALSGCGVTRDEPKKAQPATPTSPAPSSPTPSGEPSAEPSAAAGAVTQPSDGRPRRATLDISAIGVRGLAVVPYRGTTDDAAGTQIQDRGVAATPHGPEGGTGPGGVGNYLVTAHRTSSTRAFAATPQLRRGDRVRVDVGTTRYVYEIVRTRSTSFRSPASLAAQRAAVPGRPGATPTRAMITLSTCATAEDHAAGNYWSDEFHNPEHRIDKIGVLVGRSGPG